MNEHEKYLKQDVPSLLSNLTLDQEPSFGIMTAQHMVEHLIWITKTSVKDMGLPPDEIPEKALGFMRFIQKGAHFKHRPSNKKRSDLDPPRMDSLDAAVAEIPNAISRLYSQPRDKVFYNPLMGRLTFDEMELFHAKHYEYHLETQFELKSQ